jgi:hypothetical protein
MSHIVFFGINGIGLGHIARLGAIQCYLADTHPEYSTEALCRSTMGDRFFTCPCTNVPKGRDLTKALGIRGISGFFNIIFSKLIASRRKTVVFDTWWSRSVIRKLKRGGHRTVLVMQSFKPDDMYSILSTAPECFDHIFFPCQPEEIRFHYKSHEKLWALLQDPKFEAVGPFVRPADKSDNTEKVIFTLGGGGGKDDEDPRYSVRSYIEQYVEAARILHEAGKTNLYLAKGPLMEVDVDLGHLKVLETMKLPDHFGPHTTVITRGTYNLTWEAIQAGAKLVATTRSAVLPEFSDSRNRYLESCGYAYQSEMTGAALAEAILHENPINLEEATDLVNARPGLARITKALIRDDND